MAQEILAFYEALADHYHLIFDDWDRAIDRQAAVLGSLLSSSPQHSLKILDCACGIGTQALGFARMGYQVVASDISPAAIERARREARIRALDISFHVSDMTSLAEITDHDFDVAAALDNALPHLSAAELLQAMQTIASKLKQGGLFLASIRDYDTLQYERPTIQQPSFFGAEGSRRVVHQVWEWIEDGRYRVHLYLTLQAGRAWKVHHFISEYRCLLRDELSTTLNAAGFCNIRWMMPAESGFYQPIILATAPS